MLFWVTEQQLSMPKGSLIISTDLLTKTYTHLLSQTGHYRSASSENEQDDPAEMDELKGQNQASQMLRAGWKAGGEYVMEKQKIRVRSQHFTNPVVAHDTTVPEFLTSIPITPRTVIQGVWRKALLGCGGQELEGQAPPQARIPLVSEGTRQG